jgi:diacylglycerol O-acyltransferase
MSEPLSPADRSALAAEQGPVNMAVGGLLVFDPHPSVTREGLLARLSERIHLAPRLRQRLAEPALGLTNPLWVDDRDFDLEWHVRHTVVPAPGGERELGALVGREMSRRLDRSRPLWEMTLIDGLPGGRVGLLARLHHALVDGVAAMAIGILILDPGPEPLEIPPPEDPWEPRPYALRRHLTRLATGPVVQARNLMLDTVGRALDPDPRRAAGDLKRATELLTELARSRPQAPATTLNRTITANRRFVRARAGLQPLKVAGREAGGTVNDAILSIIAGTLRRSLGPREWERDPVALVPVSVRREGEEGGNRISTVLVDLPVEIEDPIARIAAVSERMATIKSSAAVRAGALMVGASGAAPPLVSSMLARAMSGVRAFNLVVSNVPGPSQPLYLAGARLLDLYPVLPLNPANQGLNVGVLSYNGHVFFGLIGDAELEPALSDVRTALLESIAELGA